MKIKNQKPEIIADTFADLVRSVSAVVKETKHQHAVDVRMLCRSASLSKKGIPIFSKKTKSSDMEIELATRITYDGNILAEDK